MTKRTATEIRYWTADPTGRILAGPFLTHADAETHREYDRRPSEIVALPTYTGTGRSPDSLDALGHGAMSDRITGPD